MSWREPLLQALLWYSTFAWGSWFGGTLYQMVVVVPLWSAAPPDSVRAFFRGTDYNRTIFRFFGPPWMAARTVPVLLAFVVAWDLPDQRRALALALVCLAAAIVYTFARIYPINAVLFEQAGGSRSPAEIADLARRWIRADRLRFAIGSIAFAAILWAFRLPLPGR